MNKKYLTFIVSLILFLILFSGCTKQDETNMNDDAGETADFMGESDSISINGSGGSFSLLNDHVQFTFPSGCVSEEVEITVESISNPVSGGLVTMFSVYEFGPDGLTFEKPVDLIIRFKDANIPQSINERDIVIFVLNGNTWEPIEGSFGNAAMDWSVAEITHFSKMGGGFYTSPDTDEGQEDSDDEDDEDGFSQYWFKADFYYYDYVTPRYVDYDDEDDYHVGVSAYWDPVSYAQYYQLKFVYNGNNPTPYAWSCNYREQSKSYCHKTEYPYAENEIYHLGGNPDIKGFISVITEGDAIHGYVDQETGEHKEVVVARLWPEGQIGYTFWFVKDEVDDSEGLSQLEKGTLVSNMQSFVQSYTHDWEVWVRGVTETHV